MKYPFADLELAQRLEHAEARANAAFIEARAKAFPDWGAKWIEVAGAYAMFDGPTSPVTQTFGLKVLYLRKIQKNAKEQFEDLRRSVLLHVKHEFTNGVLHFYNGSRMFLGHFRNEGDIDQYLGIEYDLIVIEELTTLSLLKYRALRDSNRTSKPGFRPRIYATFNPGGIGHAWVKALFIVPSRKKKETDTRFIFGT